MDREGEREREREREREITYLPKTPPLTQDDSGSKKSKHQTKRRE